MARGRQKTRTHKTITPDERNRIPKNMVLLLGSALNNNTLCQLVKDLRVAFQPHTAVKLKERKSNKLKDFVVMAGPLGVSEIISFKQSQKTGKISLRFGKLPRGPTLQFRVNSYSLSKDVIKNSKNSKPLGKNAVEILTPPFLIIKGFPIDIEKAENHEKLLVKMFQNMFPPIDPENVRISSIKRVILLHRDAETKELNLRHYSISTKNAEKKNELDKLLSQLRNSKKEIPKLTHHKDISELVLDYVVDGGFSSESETEIENIVEIDADSVVVCNNKNNFSKGPVEQDVQKLKTKKKISLVELGPRISLTLMKIEEGLVGSSKVLYHSQIDKSQKEIDVLDIKHNLRKKLKEKRRSDQENNVAAKKKKRSQSVL